MLTEQQLQFRVGLFTLTAMSILATLLVKFGEFSNRWSARVPYRVELDTAGGLYPTAPVTMSGLMIGNVDRIELNPQGTGATVWISLKQSIQLRSSSQALVSRSFLGDSSIEISPGRTGEVLKSKEAITGVAALDPMQLAARLEARVDETLKSFASTSREWQLVGRNVNALVDTKRGDLDAVIERTAESLHQFTVAMTTANQMLKSANEIVGDPATQASIRTTVQSLPRLVEETRATITATRQTIDSVNRNMTNLSHATDPLSKHGESIVAKLDHSLASLDSLLTEMYRFSKLVNTKDGSLQKLASDPSLYQNLDRSAESLSLLMRNLGPVLIDLREFTDKVARNPEILGVGGAMRPSTGLRDAELNRTGVRPASATSDR